MGILDESLSEELRMKFKAVLWERRGELLTPSGYVPICPVCNCPITEGNADLHEAIFTRWDVVRLPKEQKIWINHPCNVDFRHHVCPDGKNYHTSGHGGDALWARFATHIIQFEGRRRVMEYVFAVVTEVPVLFPTVHRLKVLGV